MTAIEAVAEAWASIEGRLIRFRAGKTDRSPDRVDGTYQGYMVEAAELIARVERRGFVLVARDGAP